MRPEVGQEQQFLGSFTVGEYIRVCETMLEGAETEERAKVWEENIAWAKRFDTFTMVDLWHDRARGILTQKVIRGSENFPRA